MSLEVTRRKLFEALIKTSSTSYSWSSRYKSANLIIKEMLRIDTLNSAIKFKLHQNYIKIRSKWENCNRDKKRFMKCNSNWLDTTITLSTSSDSKACVQLNPGGRPQKEFGSCSERSKSRKASEICDTHDTELLVYAAQKSLRSDGKYKEAKLMKEAIMTTHSQSKKINETSNKITSAIAYISAEALALMIEAGLTKSSYQIIRTQAKSRGADIYPSYKKIREAKAECYPPEESIHITETICEIKLQVWYISF